MTPSGGPLPFFPSASACGPFKHGGAGEGASQLAPGAHAPAQRPRLDVSSDGFDPLLAHCALPPIPYPQRALLQQRGRIRELPQDRVTERRARTGARARPWLRGARCGLRALGQDPPPPGRPRPDPERIQRLRRLMVTKEGDEAAEGAAAGSRSRQEGATQRCSRECPVSPAGGRGPAGGPEGGGPAGVSLVTAAWRGPVCVSGGGGLGEG